MFRIVSSLYDVVGIYAVIEVLFIFGAIAAGIWMLIEFSFEDDIKKRWKIISMAATVCLIILSIGYYYHSRVIKYRVVLNDGYKYEDLLNDYDVINTEGEIYTIVEKDNDTR